MLDFLRSTAEWQQWGMNMLTFSSIGAIVLTLIQAWSFIRQARRIWSERSGESVSVKMFGYLLFYLISFVIYGIAMRKVTMIINGALFIVVIPIVLGLCKFKVITKGEQLCLLLFGFMPVWMAISGQKELLFFGMLVGLLAAFACPAYEIWRNKNAGSVEVRVVIASMFTNAFWTAYALMVWDVPLIIFNPISFVLMVATLFLWKKYQRKSACAI